MLSKRLQKHEKKKTRNPNDYGSMAEWEGFEPSDGF